MSEKSNNPIKIIFYLSLSVTVLAWLVIQLGAYTRLTNAGLGCPDWPGCYGHLNVMQLVKSTLLQTTTLTQAWTEMVHRYLAGSLGVGLLLLLFVALWQHRALRFSSKLVLGLLPLLILLQAALGMWTVTEKLHPTVVTAHLLGGMGLVALLTWLTASLKSLNSLDPVNKSRGVGDVGAQAMGKVPASLNRYKPWAWLALLLVAVQISLGGWTSTNYAGLACPTFPHCQGLWAFPADLKTVFSLWSPLGLNYQGGVFGMAVRMTLQMMHRYMAVILIVYLLVFGLFLYRSSRRSLRCNVLLMLALLALQVGLGIVNALYLLPLGAAVAHNSVAALLLMSVVLLNYQLAHNKIHE